MKAPKTPEYEFGGPIGATGIVFGLPILMQLLYLGCNDVSGCPAPALLDPKTLTWQRFKEQTPWPKEGIWGLMSWEVTGWLFAYYFLSLVLYRVLPAQEVYGTKLRESGKALKYRFNSFSSSVVQLIACAVGTYIYGAEFPVWTFMTTNYLQLLTTSTVLTFIVSIYIYVGSFSVKKGNPELRELAKGGHTGRIIYDFFIGRELNPRVTLPIFGEIDIKSWLEMRTALTGWILFNCAFIAQQYRNYGYVSDSILVIATVQAYYVLEGQYSELGLLGMMDITQDGLGFMLTWGNMVWVPFLYSTQCRYLSVYPVHLGPVGVSAIATVFAIGLYIFRSSNNQKALFRKNPNHPAFANMTFIQTKRGTKLLTGGWWGMARHINYFGDWLQSLPFSLPTKVAGYVILPAGSAVAGNEVVKMLDGRLVTPDGAAPWGMLFTYFYSAWFGFLLIHREKRDDAACIEKYGKDWDEYKNKVRYRILPAHGLYIGYKRRNAQLDPLDENPPDCLAGTHIPLANDDFDSVDDSKEMEEIIDHLHVKWNTLNRVIEAPYIDKLVSHRHIVLLALGRARKRLMAILYKKERWYSWVRDAQDDEEANGEKDHKKLKHEAALFKGHMKQMEARMELMRKTEEQKLQDAFLEEAYRERMAMNEDADDDAWDPIEDMEDEQRHRYIDLIKHFLWMEVEVDEATAAKPASTDASSSKPAEEPAPAEEVPAPTKKLKNKKKNKGKANAAANISPLEELQNLLGQKKPLAMQASGKRSTETELKEPDKKNIETEEEMRKRLSQGVKKKLDNVSSMQLVGTIENPHETWDKTAPMEDDEIDELIRDIREIKLLLFCRLVLLQASLLPTALRATTVQEFLDDTSVTEVDLRDLCLKVAEPTLQNIRDEKTMRTRQIKPGEDLKSLWDTIADERSEFRLFDVSNKKVTMRKDTELAESPCMFYNKANEVEDAILFPGELTSERKSFAFREIRNGVASIEDGILPSTARHYVKGLEAINKGKDSMKAMRMAKHDDQDTIWGLPKIWETALLQARGDKLKKSQKALLQRTGLLNAYKTLSYDRRLEESDPMEMMEQDRAFSFRESFHAGDLEPGYNAKYNLLQETLRAMLKTPHDPQYPWPHSFIMQVIVQAFAMIAMFFPNSDVAKLPRRVQKIKSL
ncbi:delta14-sterol reductase [Fusarium sp. NRRL 52700]|nr:delta14-sterol reductase [Fusarium sp. NRRL 52700]